MLSVASTLPLFPITSEGGKIEIRSFSALLSNGDAVHLPAAKLAAPLGVYSLAWSAERRAYQTAESPFARPRGIFIAYFRGG